MNLEAHLLTKDVHKNLTDNIYEKIFKKFKVLVLYPYLDKRRDIR